MIKVETDRDTLYKEIRGLVSSVVCVTETPEHVICIRDKVDLLKYLGDTFYHKMMDKISNQRNRVISTNNN